MIYNDKKYVYKTNKIVGIGVNPGYSEYSKELQGEADKKQQSLKESAFSSNQVLNNYIPKVSETQKYYALRDKVPTLTIKALKENLAHIYLESLPLDNHILENCERGIKDDFIKRLEEDFTDDDLLKLCNKTTLLREMVETCENLVESKISEIVLEKKEDREPLPEEMRIKSEEVKSYIPTDMKTASNVILRKVKDTIKMEKKISQFEDDVKNKLNEAQYDVDIIGDVRHSLFKSILKESYNEAYKAAEDGTISESLLEDYQDGVRINKDLLLAEAIMKYGYMETLNTLKLKDYKVQDLRHIQTYHQI